MADRAAQIDLYVTPDDDVRGESDPDGGQQPHPGLSGWLDLAVHFDSGEHASSHRARSISEAGRVVERGY